MGTVDYSDPVSFFKAIGAGGPGRFPMPGFKSAEDVRREAAARSGEIFTGYETLHAILELKILLSAWPNMAAIHRPGFDAFRRESESDRDRGTKYRDHYMWPCINQEDLLDTKALPLLLNARGRHPPSHFAAADIDAMHLGLVTKAFVPIFLDEHVMILNGFAENTRDYGLLVMEAQARLLAILVQCCRVILHDIPESSLTSDSFPILPEPQLKADCEISGFQSLRVMAAEAPYRVPAELDLSRIESLLSARTSAAEDHLWALREDPHYFARTLLDVKEHRQEMLKDLYGNAHPVLSPSRQDVFWARVIGSALSTASQARKLVMLQRQYAGEYLMALLCFRHYLNQAAKGILSVLEMVVVASPPSRRLFARVPPPDADTSITLVRENPRIKMSKLERELIWLLRMLWEDGTELFLTKMPVVPQARELVSSFVSGLIGDLAIVSQVWEAQILNREGDLEQGYAKRSRRWARMLDAFSAALPQKAKSSNAVRLGNPSGSNFHYPISKRRTKETVDALRMAEACLGAFWVTIDWFMMARAGDLKGTAVGSLLSQSRILQRTKEWVEPEKPGPAVSAQAKAKANESDFYASYLPISRTYSGISTRSPDTTFPREKIKTRGTPQSPVSPVETGAFAQPSSPDCPLAFTIDQRAYRVFRTLFFNPSITATPGEIPWNDFIHAMTSVGFTAMKLYGSRSIQFYEPHPQRKLPFTTARRYGRRLSRAYGWFGGMFVLGEKRGV
ncbi:hypothetical protein BJX61DRAFT_550398 [Aspergillus egyptiacus]|nr:hypothetical protein BJX61DRAFT_550398 [Aspergillus egyptiacus]